MWVSASALNALNDKGIVHRDMKPQNILICCAKGCNKLSTPPTQLQLKIGVFFVVVRFDESRLCNDSDELSAPLILGVQRTYTVNKLLAQKILLKNKIKIVSDIYILSLSPTSIS